MTPSTVDMLIDWLETNRHQLDLLDRAKITFHIANQSIKSEVAQNYDVSSPNKHRRPPVQINGHHR